MLHLHDNSWVDTGAACREGPAQSFCLDQRLRHRTPIFRNNVSLSERSEAFILDKFVDRGVAHEGRIVWQLHFLENVRAFSADCRRVHPESLCNY